MNALDSVDQVGGASEATSISVKVSLTNGRLLTPANADRIFVRATSPCRGVIHPRISPGYFECYRLEKRATGWGFTEVTHGMGINGYRHRTVREAVQNTLLLGFGFKVEVRAESTKATNGRQSYQSTSQRSTLEASGCGWRPKGRGAIT